jgi:nuclear transport factor 2 (NTF2) superfamily protein
VEHPVALRHAIDLSFAADDLSRDPETISKAYTENSIWRNRHWLFTGRGEIVKFLTKKWQREKSYKLRKELFAFTDNKIAVQFWYEVNFLGPWKCCAAVGLTLY